MKQSWRLRILVRQSDLTVIPYIAGVGATVPRKSLIQMLWRPPELARVPTHSTKLREMAFPWKSRGISENLPSNSGNFWQWQNLRQFSGNGYGRFKCCFWQSYVVFFTCFAFSFQTNHWKNKPFINSPRVNICNIYIPMVNWWMACIQLNNGGHFHFMEIRMLWT